MFYFDMVPALEKVSAEMVGSLFLAAMKYAQTGEFPVFDDVVLDFAWELIKPSIDRDSERYTEKKARGEWLTYCRKCKQDDINPIDFETWRERADNDTLQDDTYTLPTTTPTPSSTPTPSPSPTTTNSPLTPQREEETMKKRSEDDRFSEFWSAYPKKVAKQYALKAWKRLKPNADLHQRILKAVEDQKQSEQWRKNNGQYIPNPATWLNGGQWDNEMEGTKNNAADQRNDQRSDTEYAEKDWIKGFVPATDVFT